MEKLMMRTPDLAEEKYKKLAALFPNAVTEMTDEDGNIVRAIDKDVLMQEINTKVVDDNQERYQFTWPDKKKSVILANTPIEKTLRFDKEKSVGRDGTLGGTNSENIYIEGDNLDALKLLQEMYLGKVKMIYIDPPYNTGNDLIYKNKFFQRTTYYFDNSGQKDEDENRLVQNSESNGRFHTDWLNMIYPRIKMAKDFLSDDGVMFISIDDNEIVNLNKCCSEIFGESNFIAQIPWRKRTAKSDVPFGVSQDYEYIVCFAKSHKFVASIDGKKRKYYETDDFIGKPWRIHDLTTQRTAGERPNSYFTIINPKTGDEYPANPNATWRITVDTIDKYISQNKIVFPGDYKFLKISKPVLRYWKEEDMKKAGDKFGRIAVSTKLPDDIGMSQDGTKEIIKLFGTKVFNFPKPSSLIKYLISVSTEPNDIIFDFFSGSATVGDAVMQLNSEDCGQRKYIMVQLSEKTDEKSDAFKAGYKTICDIGEERIRRAGMKIKEETGADIDYGFRCFKVDSSNMKDVYYRPAKLVQINLDQFIDNIKEDRTPEDLLIQVMLDLGVLLSSKVEKTEIKGKKVFLVADGYLIACFDKNVAEDVVTAIAKKHPYYAVFRDSSMTDDSVAANFDQIFNSYSPQTVRKVL